MFSKKGTAWEEFTGALIFMVISAIVLLFFLGCSVSNAKQKYEQLTYTKKEILVIRDLNYFLEKPFDSERTMSDIILEYLERASLDKDDPDYIKHRDFIGKMDELFKDHFSKPRRLLVIFPDGGILYDSSGFYNRRQMGFSEIAEGVARLPVSTELFGYEHVEVVLQ